MERRKPVLVTGATGSVGSVLVKRFCENGQLVRVVVRNPGRTDHLRNNPNVEIITGDLTRPDSLRGCAQGCSLVYHCAADLGVSNWARSYATNVKGTQAIIEEAARAGVERLVYTSTIGVYGVCSAEEITEETPWVRYHHPYFETKQAAERIVEQAVRPGKIAGDDLYVRIVPQMGCPARVAHDCSDQLTVFAESFG